MLSNLNMPEKPNRKLKIALFYSLMFSMTLIICFLILEYGFSKFYYSNVIYVKDKDFDPELGWLYKTGTYWIKPTHSFFKHSIYINKHGLRNREINLTKENGTKRIIILGDSFTFSKAIKDEDIFPRRLEIILNQNSPDKYEIINAGVEGYGTVQELLLMRRLADNNVTGDIYLLMIFLNDILDNLCLTYAKADENLVQPKYDLYNNKLVLRRQPEKETKDTGNLISVRGKKHKIMVFKTLKIKLESFLQTKPLLISFFNNIGLDIKFPRVPGIITGYNEEILKNGIPILKESIREIKSEAERHHAKLLISLIPSPLQVYPDTYGPLLKRTFPDNRLVDKWLEDKLVHQRLIKEICKELNIPFLDLFPILYKNNNKEMYISMEGHFSEKGHAIVADSLTTFINQFSRP